MIKVKLWVYTESGGDGSVIVRHFNSAEEADAFAENDEDRFCEDIYAVELQIDELTGKLLNPDVKDR
jgi:hypothetical protein